MGKLIVDDSPELNQTLRHEHVRGKICEACSVHDRPDAEPRRPLSPAILEFRNQQLQAQLDAAETRAKTAEQLNTILTRKLERFEKAAKGIADDVEELAASMESTLNDEPEMFSLRPAA